MASIDRAIRVTAQIFPAQAAATERFGGALIATTGDELDASGPDKVQSFRTLEAVGDAGFAESGDVYLAAASYFAQTPSPSSLFVGRWANTRAASELRGGTFSTAPTPASLTGTATILRGAAQTATPTSWDGGALTGLTPEGGSAQTVTVTLSSPANHDAVAAAVQAGLRGATALGSDRSEIEVEYVGSGQGRYVITVPDSITIPGALTGDLAGDLKMLAADNPDLYAPFTVSVDGNSATVRVKLNAATGGTVLTTIEAVRANLQSALQAATPTGFSTLAVSYDQTVPRFEIGDGTSTGTPRTLTAGTGALADAMRLSTAEGADVAEGSVAETAADFISAVSAISNDWYWLVPVGSDLVDNASTQALATAIAASRKQIMIDSRAGDVLTDAASSAATTASTQPALIIARAHTNRASVIWSRHADNKAAALAGVFAGYDLNRPATAVSAKFRPLSGREADDLTPAQLDALDRVRINYYTQFGNSAIVAEGVSTAKGVFIETQWWLDWFTQEVQGEVFELLRSSIRIPQTAAGISRIKDRVEDVCIRGVSNGGIAPGPLGDTTTAAVRSVTGNPDFDGELSQGYLVYVAPLSTLTESQLTAGNIPPVHIWMKGAGGVHFIDLDVTIQQ